MKRDIKRSAVADCMEAVRVRDAPPCAYVNAPVPHGISSHGSTVFQIWARVSHCSRRWCCSPFGWWETVMCRTSTHGSLSAWLSCSLTRTAQNLVLNPRRVERGAPGLVAEAPLWASVVRVLRIRSLSRAGCIMRLTLIQQCSTLTSHAFTSGYGLRFILGTDTRHHV